MGIVLAQDIRIQLHHLHGYKFETAFFKTRNYLTNKTALNGARLQYYKCSFHAAKIVQAERRKKSLLIFYPEAQPILSRQVYINILFVLFYCRNVIYYIHLQHH